MEYVGMVFTLCIYELRHDLVERQIRFNLSEPFKSFFTSPAGGWRYPRGPIETDLVTAMVLLHLQTSWYPRVTLDH